MSTELLKNKGKNKKNTMINRDIYDDLWNKLFYAGFGLTFIGTFYMIRGVGKFRSQLMSLNPNYEFSKYSDFLICIPLLTFYSIFRYFAQKQLIKVCEKIMKKAYRFPTNENDRFNGKKYRLKLPDHAFKIVMYFALTVFGYYILKDLNYFPKSLLGKGWLPNMFIKGYPNSFYLEKPPLFDFYYMVCLSFFISDFIWLLFINEKQTDFINMLLHHICTITLIIFSHLVHYSNVGSIVIFLHLETDILVHLTRFFLQIEIPEIIREITGFLLLCNFVYARVYVLGDIIYVLYHYVTWKGIVDWFLLIFLVIIYIMHINWAIMLLQKSFDLCMGKKLTDTRDYNLKENGSKKINSKSF